MSRTTLLVGGGVLAALVVVVCYRQGRPFTGFTAVRAGAATYVDKLANVISPVCCTGCQAQAAAASAAQAAAVASTNATATASSASVPADATDPGAGLVA